MGIKFSEDVVPLTDLKVNPGRVVRHAAEAHRPVLLTSRGRGVAVVQSVTDFEAAEDEREFATGRFALYSGTHPPTPVRQAEVSRAGELHTDRWSLGGRLWRCHLRPSTLTSVKERLGLG